MMKCTFYLAESHPSTESICGQVPQVYRVPDGALCLDPSAGRTMRPVGQSGRVELWGRAQGEAT